MFGKFNIAGALRDQGVNPLSIVEGRNADAQFPFSNYSRQQLALVNHLVDHIYRGFIQKVLPWQPDAGPSGVGSRHPFGTVKQRREALLLTAQVALGRGLSEKEVRQLARGRVWTGKDALQQGLVDALGGLQQAIDLAKQEAGLPLQVRYQPLPSCSGSGLPHVGDWLPSRKC